MGLECIIHCNSINPAYERMVHYVLLIKQGSKLFNNAWFWYQNADLIFLKILIGHLHFSDKQRNSYKIYKFYWIPEILKNIKNRTAWTHCQGFNNYWNNSKNIKNLTKGLIRLKRIYNFWCSMLVYTPFALCFVTFRGIFTHFSKLTY
jgi:hypothetical protein